MSPESIPATVTEVAGHAEFPELLTMAQAAAALGCSTKTIGRMVTSGHLRRVEIGGFRRFVADDIRGLIEARLVSRIVGKQPNNGSSRDENASGTGGSKQ
jgi:excisionase family DNA binding protein